MLRTVSSCAVLDLLQGVAVVCAVLALVLPKRLCLGSHNRANVVDLVVQGLRAHLLLAVCPLPHPTRTLFDLGLEVLVHLLPSDALQVTGMP
jgi:hypothetical protein